MECNNKIGQVVNVKKMRRFSIVVITILAVIFIIFFRLPIKKTVKINSQSIEQRQVSEKDTKLICKFVEVTGPRWEVVGNNNGLFNKPGYEYIIIKGNIPPDKSWELVFDDNSKNKFVFEGNLVGEEIADDGGKYKVFNVKKWSMAYPIIRGYGIFDPCPSNALTRFDYFLLGS